MMKKTINLLGLIFLSFSFLLAQGKIYHNPPSEAQENSDVSIQAVIEGNLVGVLSVNLYYRSSEGTSYIQQEMIEKLGVYYGTIPASFVRSPGIEYYIEAELVDGSALAFPEVDPFNVPIFVQVTSGLKKNQVARKNEPGSKGNLESGALILSPEENEVVAIENVLIAISLFNVESVDLNSVRIFINDKEVTKYAVIERELVTVQPPINSPGIKIARVEFSNEYGTEYIPLSWRFKVVSSEKEVEKLLEYSGKILAESRSEQIRGVFDDVQRLNATFRGGYDWLRFDGMVNLTTRESPDYQPRNRYSLGLHTSYLDLNFGDVFPKVSPFSIYGKRVRGLNFDLKLKYVNFYFVKGETERAVRGDFSVDSTGYTDPGTNELLSLYKRANYTFQRNLTAGRLYFGEGNKFQFGLSLLKARDDTTSVERYISGIPTELQESRKRIVLQGVSPNDNIVIGSDMLVAIDDRRLVWETYWALSWLNRDISDGPVTKAGLDTLAPGDSLIDGNITFEGTSISLDNIPNPALISDWFIISKDMVPFLPVAPDSTGKIPLKSLLNMSSGAFRTLLKLNYYNNYIVFRYQQIGPKFNSLGNPYQRQDFQGMSISDKIRLFDNRIFINLSYEHFRDNLVDDKPATTSTNIFTAGFSLFPGPGLPTINFNTLHYARANDVADSEVDNEKHLDSRENNITLRQTISLSHSIFVAGLKNDLNLNYSNATKTDQVPTREDWFVPIGIVSKMLQASVATTYPFPLKSILNVSTSINSTEAINIDNDLKSFGLELRSKLFNSHLMLNGGTKMMFGTQPISTGNIDVDGFPIYDEMKFVQNNFFGGFTFKFLEHHQIYGRVDYNLLNDKYSNTTYNDYIANLRYIFIF